MAQQSVGNPSVCLVSGEAGPKQVGINSR
ncbi:hypothetical protein EE612_002741 [Oryza sativa]|nr:hypothetical protein EE612_002741 [Oryza sativa]